MSCCLRACWRMTVWYFRRVLETKQTGSTLSHNNSRDQLNLSLTSVLVSTTAPLYLGLNMRPIIVEATFASVSIPRCMLLMTKLVTGYVGVASATLTASVLLLRRLTPHTSLRPHTLMGTLGLQMARSMVTTSRRKEVTLLSLTAHTTRRRVHLLAMSR